MGVEEVCMAQYATQHKWKEWIVGAAKLDGVSSVGEYHKPTTTMEQGNSTLTVADC